MSEIAVAVRDPRGKRHAQLLHDDLPVREVVLILADRLELPTKLHYELIDLKADKALDAKKTLQAAGIAAGADLQLRPVHDKVFGTFVKVLKDEIKDELRDEALEQAIETLIKLDADSGVAKAAASSGQEAAEAGPRDAAAKSEPAKSGSCLRTGLIGLGVIILLTAAAGYLLFDDVIKPSLNELLPGFFEPPLGTGDVQVTLRWDTPVDLDLHVIDPLGEEIYFNHSFSQSGGTLDVDANGGCDNDTPVENVFWPTGGAPFGRYQVFVVFYQDCGYTGANAYALTILVDGQTLGPYEGLLSTVGQQSDVISFGR
jgi:hypothetical protein